MRVMLFNDGDFGDAENVNFPVEVEALSLTDGGYFKISKNELHRVGFRDFDTMPEWSFENGTEAVEVTITDTHCDITNKCCNQFGERDEMQAIINSLQADVIARGARIAELEDLLAEITFILQSDVPTKVADVLDRLGVSLDA